jgi:hypothetical protein
MKELGGCLALVVLFAFELLLVWGAYHILKLIFPTLPELDFWGYMGLMCVLMLLNIVMSGRRR